MSSATPQEDISLPEGFVLKPPNLAQDLDQLHADHVAIVVGRKTTPSVIPPAVAESLNVTTTNAETDDAVNSEQPQEIVESRVLFDFAEHFHIADLLPLEGITTGSQTSKDCPLPLENGSSLTYGQINALAGDFFSTPTPITNSPDPKEQQVQFVKAFKTLAAGDRAKAEALLEALKVEVEKVDNAIKHHQDVRKVYEELGDRLAELQFASLQGKQPSGEDYASLLERNRDHFYPDNRHAYNAGHAKALEVASSGKHEDLILAYAMNAFADHFLQDAFASGHMRVPRVKMMNTNIFTNILANFMHNEDNVNGLLVYSPDSTKQWTCYGDSMLFTCDGKSTYQKVKKAVGASINEVWEVYCKAQKGETSFNFDPDRFEAWQYCPTEESFMSHANKCPMFTVNNGEIWQRKGLDRNPQAQLTKWEFEPVWSKDSAGYIILQFLSKEALDYIYFGVLAYKCAPTGKIKDFVLQKIKLFLLEAGLKQWIVDLIMKILGFF